MKRIFACAVLLAVCLGLGTAYVGRALGADEMAPAAPSTQPMGMDPKMMEMMQKAMTPGPQHELLKQMAGDWKAEVKFRLAPDAPEQTSVGVSKNEMIFGGRYLKQEYGGDFMGSDFHGLGLVGYDNIKQKYCAMWADEMSTGILYCDGVADESGKSITFTGEYLDPMSGKNKKFRQIVKFVDPEKQVADWYDTAPDGKEFISMTITYTKQK